MSETEQVGGLGIEEDQIYQRRSWLIERIGWVIIALILLAGMAGFMGQGLFNNVTISDSSGVLKLEYSHFMRKHNPDTLRFEIAASAIGQDQKARIWLNQDYLKGLQLDQVTPEPESVET